VNERGQAAGANPQALPLVADGHEGHLFLTAGTAKTPLGDVGGRAFVHQYLGLGLVKVGGLARFKAQGPSGANRQTKASPIAERLVHYARFTVYYDDSALSARRHTSATTIAQSLINTHDLSNYHLSPHLTRICEFANFFIYLLGVVCPRNFVGAGDGVLGTDSVAAGAIGTVGRADDGGAVLDFGL
jgi:hypothetical protein